MKEFTINIPEDSSDLVIELVERLGGSVEKKERINKRAAKTNIKPQKKIAHPGKKSKKEKMDHTCLFGKWKDFDIDARQLREDSWKRY